MNQDTTQAALKSHQRAHQLMTASRVEGISDTERKWLDSHLAGCARCAEEASAVGAVIDSLRTARGLASAEMVQRTRLAARRHAEALAIERARTVPLWIAVAVSAVWVVITAPYIWGAFASLGRAVRVPDPVWQVGFLMWWFLPATVVAAIVAWRHAGVCGRGSHWAAQTNWGQP